MQIELIRGPADGTLVMVPENTKLWVISGLAVGTQMAEDEVVTTREYCYAHTAESNGRGAWRFEYVGERVFK